jgi:type I restriction enzyme, S subunit
MAGDWRECHWEEIATLAYGKSLRGYEEAQGEYPVFGTNGPIGWHNQPLCMHPGVIIGRKGAYRGVHYSPKPFYVIDTAFYLEPKEDMDLRWAYYCLLTYDINAMDSGSAIPSTSREAFYHLRVQVPPLKQQQAIACILGALDDKIELNRGMNRTLEEMARAIFKSWFVDFDPVRAKAAVRREHPKWTDQQVGRAACPNLKPEIAALFPDAFQDSELGEIPKGWSYVTLGEIAEVNWGDTSVTKKSYVDHGFLAFSAKGPDEFLSYYDYDRTGIVVSAIGANSGYTWLARGKWSCIKNTIRFWATNSSVSTEYLFLATHGDNIWPVRGSAQPFISQTDARNIAVLFPSSGEAKVFGGLVEPFLAKIETNEIESRVLASIRDTLLPKLISGELRVPDAERIAGRCA